MASDARVYGARGLRVNCKESNSRIDCRQSGVQCHPTCSAIRALEDSRSDRRHVKCAGALWVKRQGIKRRENRHSRDFSGAHALEQSPPIPATAFLRLADDPSNTKK